MIIIGVFAWSSFGVWGRVSDAFSVPMLESAPEKCVFTNRVCRCCLKRSSIREETFMLESRRASLHNVKVIKMSRLTIDRFFILWSLHGSLRCCETDCTTFLSLDTQEVERGQLWWSRNLCIFNCAYLFVWSRLKFSVRVWPKSTRVDIISCSENLKWYLSFWHVLIYWSLSGDLLYTHCSHLYRWSDNTQVQCVA